MNWYIAGKSGVKQLMNYKRILSVILIIALSVSLLTFAAASSPGFSNFTYSNNYRPGLFSDVTGSEWFAPFVQDAYNFGFISGKSAGIFDPGGILTLGEAVTLAARLSSIYHTGQADFPVSEPYYMAYADYALQNGIISSHPDYSAAATRAQFAEMSYNALPPDAFPAINDIPDYGICDVMPDTDSGEAIYALYRAGVLSGSDRFGTFFPDSNITRAEVSALMIRLADPGFRVKTVLPTELPAEVIFARNADAVFMIETFNKNGKSIRTGTAFFISESGLAVTNHHVLDDAASATITLYNGETYPVRGVHAVSMALNLVVLSIDSDKGGWSFVSLADSDLIEEGNLVYTIGSPWELINTMSEGIISSKGRDVSGEWLIQFTAPISFGSGGSPVFNSLGQVIGVASSSFSYGQNLNLAVPVNHIKSLEIGEFVTLESLLQY